ncbi:DUF2637 domain-containing protein [Streptomyces peucetius]|uniref:DUF2637 domain-containing protein n=1 Tax=Streptomyces peucetius TaxID=1950 RepID=A0ABY6HZ87_STRPE|nr:DUF2637 domain-containing protein [Streptomyces peucetius]UYQ60028.1 DUF2637 domain-containing protein [Streptomyces peucetius]
MTITADLGNVAPAARGRRRIVWTRGRRVTFGIIGFGSLLIAMTGFVGSYTAVRDLAIEKDFGWFATLFPLGIDVGIIVMLSLDLALTWAELRYPLLRHIAWLLTIATVAFNAAAAYPDILASTMHATIPLLFIAITEAVRHAVETATARDAGREDYALSLGRWVLAPWSTWLIWRSRKLWPSTISSYEVALALYQEKQDYRQELRDAYGWRWRRKATREELRPLRRSRLGFAVRAADEPLIAGPVRVEPVVPELEQNGADSCEGHVYRAFPPCLSETELERPVDRSLSRLPRHPAAVATEAGQATSLEHPDEDSSAGNDATDEVAESAEEAAKAPRGDTGSSDEQDGTHEDGDAIEGDHSPSPPAIDLGPTPENESKRQRAERIYLAHQEAGVKLTRKDLTRWAGYRNEGSGRAAYTQLEREHGPIVAQDHVQGTDIAFRNDLAQVRS